MRPPPQNRSPWWRAFEFFFVVVYVGMLLASALHALNPQWGDAPWPVLREMAASPALAWGSVGLALLTAVLVLHPRCHQRAVLNALAVATFLFGIGLMVVVSISGGAGMLILMQMTMDKIRWLDTGRGEY